MKQMEASTRLLGVYCDVLCDRPVAGAFTSFSSVSHHNLEFPPLHVGDRWKQDI